MIYQATEIVNFAQGQMAMFGTYLAWSMLNHGLPYWAAFFLTLALAFVGGLLIERIVVQPVEKVGADPGHRVHRAVGDSEQRGRLDLLVHHPALPEPVPQGADPSTGRLSARTISA